MLDEARHALFSSHLCKFIGPYSEGGDSIPMATRTALCCRIQDGCAHHARTPWARARGFRTPRWTRARRAAFEFSGLVRPRPRHEGALQLAGRGVRRRGTRPQTKRHTACGRELPGACPVRVLFLTAAVAASVLEVALAKSHAGTYIYMRGIRYTRALLL